jgi:hypothetical protein
MLVAIAYCQKDQDQAQRLADWILGLGGCRGHSLLIARDVRCVNGAGLRETFAKSFDSVEEITVPGDGRNEWPFSCNRMFSTAAKHIEFTSKQPFLWLEPDAVPMRAGWLDAIAAAYVEAVTAGKHFLGDRVEVENVPLHMSGVGVYPGVMSNHAGLAYLSHDMAWDVCAAEQIVPQAQFTNLIEHAWKHPTFESWEQVEREIAPETVLYHASKDGSLIRLLRERKNLPVSRMMDLDASKTADDGPRADRGHAGGVKNIVCDIFIKTYPPDYPWLRYCLRSISRFVIGVRRTLLVTPEDRDRQWWDGNHFLDLTVKELPEHGPDGYLSQQVSKLYADTLTDASHILYLDSDTIFTRPVTPETYFIDGKPIWMMTPWANTETPWQPIVEKFLGRPVEFEFMRRHPQLVPRWLLVGLREFCEKQHGMPLDKCVMSQPLRSFSEFNAVGAFAYAFHRDRFHWINTEEVPPSEWPALTVLQKHSWGGLTPEIEAEFEKILGKEGDAECNASADTEPTSCVQSMQASSAAPTFNPDSAANISCETLTHARLASIAKEISALPQTPWENKAASLEEIRSLADRLKNFATKPPQVRAVRQALHNAGVIQLVYRCKKRKGWRAKAKK